MPDSNNDHICIKKFITKFKENRPSIFLNLEEELEQIRKQLGVNNYGSNLSSFIMSDYDEEEFKADIIKKMEEALNNLVVTIQDVEVFDPLERLGEYTTIFTRYTVKEPEDE